MVSSLYGENGIRSSLKPNDFSLVKGLRNNADGIDMIVPANDPTGKKLYRFIIAAGDNSEISVPDSRKKILPCDDKFDVFFDEPKILPSDKNRIVPSDRRPSRYSRITKNPDDYAAVIPDIQVNVLREGKDVTSIILPIGQIAKIVDLGVDGYSYSPPAYKKSIQSYIHLKNGEVLESIDQIHNFIGIPVHIIRRAGSGIAHHVNFEHLIDLHEREAIRKLKLDLNDIEGVYSNWRYSVRVFDKKTGDEVRGLPNKGSTLFTAILVLKNGRFFLMRTLPYYYQKCYTEVFPTPIPSLDTDEGVCILSMMWDAPCVPTRKIFPAEY